MDLHIHTPASIDYHEPDTSPIQILQAAEAKGLDIIAFTDHNSVRGYADLWREIEDLELLEHLNRLQPAEAARLTEYRRLLAQILVLPGFEFTATFGFHLLAIFPESTSVRLMEHMLMTLGVAEDRFGSGEVGATTDVLKTYEYLDEHGALIIGAHVNSTHGIAMQGLRFGGQTKIAFTQDQHLHGLEVTDLMLDGGRRSTARFFNGTKAEYPRRMHCVQGSDAHRLTRDPNRETNLGIGDRPTEVELPEVSFRGLKELFLSDHFDRVRGYVGLSESVQLFRDDRAQGNTADQAFHESLSTKRTGVSHILRDLVAFANGDGGMVYIGASAFEKRPIPGVPDVDAAIAELRAELDQQVTPLPEVEIESITADGRNVLVLRASPGTEKPYALAPSNIFVREEAESVMASRDQIVAMVRATAGQVAAMAQSRTLDAPSPIDVSAPPARTDRDRPEATNAERQSVPRSNVDGRTRDWDRENLRGDERPGRTERRDNRDEQVSPRDEPRANQRSGFAPQPRPQGSPQSDRSGTDRNGNGRNSRGDTRGQVELRSRYDDQVNGRREPADDRDRYAAPAAYDTPRRDEPRRDDRPPARRDAAGYDERLAPGGRSQSDQLPRDADDRARYNERDRDEAVDPGHYEIARDERARANRSQYEEPTRRDRNDDRVRGDDRGIARPGNANAYDDYEPDGNALAPLPAGISPDGGPEEHLRAEPDRISPSSGVEILAAADVDGAPFFTLHDLRHEEIIRNVTGDTGRRLWRYAIEQFDDLDASLAATRWDGDYGFVKSYRPRGGERRYNLAYRGGGEIRVFYGVSDEDIHDGWRAVLPARGR
jgi:PHP family Zn ribbon phosphoesterase